MRALERPAVSAAMLPEGPQEVLEATLEAMLEALGPARPMAAQRQAALLATRRRELASVPARLAAAMRSAAGLARLEARAR